MGEELLAVPLGALGQFLGRGGLHVGDVLLDVIQDLALLVDLRPQQAQALLAEGQATAEGQLAQDARVELGQHHLAVAVGRGEEVEQRPGALGVVGADDLQDRLGRADALVRARVEQAADRFGLVFQRGAGLPGGRGVEAAPARGEHAAKDQRARFEQGEFRPAGPGPGADGQHGEQAQPEQGERASALARRCTGVRRQESDPEGLEDVVDLAEHHPVSQRRQLAHVPLHGGVVGRVDPLEGPLELGEPAQQVAVFGLARHVDHVLGERRGVLEHLDEAGVVLDAEVDDAGAGLAGADDLLLQSADPAGLAEGVDGARGRDVVADLQAGERRDQRDHPVGAAGGAVVVPAFLRVDHDELVGKRLLDVEVRHEAPDVGDHRVAERQAHLGLAGLEAAGLLLRARVDEVRHVAGPRGADRDEARLREVDGPAAVVHRHAHGHADGRLGDRFPLVHRLVQRREIAVDLVRGDDDRRLPASGVVGVGAGLGEKVGDQRVQLPHAGLPRELADRVEHGLVRDRDVVALVAVAGAVARDLEAARDAELLLLGIDRQLFLVEAVLDGRGEHVEVVGGPEEDHLGKVERDLAPDVIVAERAVLHGVEDLEEGLVRVPAVPRLGGGAHLVQQDDGVVDPRR
jgi:hypothetical protein